MLDHHCFFSIILISLILIGDISTVGVLGKYWGQESFKNDFSHTWPSKWLRHYCDVGRHKFQAASRRFTGWFLYLPWTRESVRPHKCFCKCPQGRSLQWKHESWAQALKNCPEVPAVKTCALICGHVYWQASLTEFPTLDQKPFGNDL